MVAGGTIPEDALAEYSLSLNREPTNFHGRALDSAQKTVDGAVYKFRDPEILDLLERALRRGVRVRLVLDGEEARSEKCLGRRLALSGAQVRHWKPERGKLHAKLMIVDGERAYTGSANWTVSARTCNQELQLELDQPDAVARFGQLFEQLWAEAEPSPR